MSAYSFRFIISILISISFIFSEFVPIHDAEKIAKYISVSRAGITESQFEVHSSIQYPSNENVLIYIINVSDLGFVMVSADNRAEPLLGYSFNHYFTDLEHPIQFDAMLNDYTKQLNYIIENNITATDAVDDAWEYYLSDDIIIHNSRDVQPLISAVWDQGHSWNDHCPEDNAGPGGNVWAGCTAVAAAQVMHYWKHPQQGVGQHGYYHPDYGELYVNFSLHNYDWDDMNNNSPTESSRKLLYHIGVGVEMQYGPYGSGSWVGQYYPSAMSALKDYFSYSQNAVFYLKDDFNEGTWKSMVKDELDANRPLMYRGYTSDGSAGHAFNIDGYQGDNFHLNWGWSGSYNGWYLITNLSPGGYNFSTWQGGVFHLTPNQVPGCTNPEACNYEQDANTDDGSCYYIGDDFGEGPICNCEGDTEYDCLGECGGDAVIDECGECNGDGSVCAGNATLSFGDINAGDQTFEIHIDSDIDIAGFQFTITDSPDNILVTHFSGGLAEENGFSVSCSDLGIVIGFSFEGNLIPASSGVLTIANYDVIGEGDSTQLCIEDVILSNQFGTSVNMTVGSCMDLALCSYSGDMNSDGIYNVLDAVIMVNMILGEMEQDFCVGDLNHDGILNILDVVMLINLILD